MDEEQAPGGARWEAAPLPHSTDAGAARGADRAAAEPARRPEGAWGRRQRRTVGTAQEREHEAVADLGWLTIGARYRGASRRASSTAEIGTGKAITARAFESVLDQRLGLLRCRDAERRVPQPCARPAYPRPDVPARGRDEPSDLREREAGVLLEADKRDALRT